MRNILCLRGLLCSIQSGHGLEDVSSIWIPAWLNWSNGIQEYVDPF